jgi:hypothetical protein
MHFGKMADILPKEGASITAAVMYDSGFSPLSGIRCWGFSTIMTRIGLLGLVSTKSGIRPPKMVEKLGLSSTG